MYKIDYEIMCVQFLIDRQNKSRESRLSIVKSQFKFDQAGVRNYNLCITHTYTNSRDDVFFTIYSVYGARRNFAFTFFFNVAV